MKVNFPMLKLRHSVYQDWQVLVRKEALLITFSIYWLSSRAHKTGMDQLDWLNDYALLPAASGGDVG